MLTHRQFVKRMLRKPAVRAEFKALEPEFALLDQPLKARARGTQPGRSGPAHGHACSGSGAS